MPKQHILIGIAQGFGSAIPQPGHVHHEGMRLIRIGEMEGGVTERVRRIERAWHEGRFQRQGLRRRELDDLGEIPGNVTLSVPCAAFDVTVGELMANPDGGRWPSAA